jgi:hypothetical protein
MPQIWQDRPQIDLGWVRKWQNIQWGSESLPDGQETKSLLGNWQPGE